VHVGAVHHLESIFDFSYGRNLRINLKRGLFNMFVDIGL
jgi:hypothetical protein